MNEILEGVIKAFQLIFSGDPRVFEVTLRALLISGIATVIAIFIGVPIAMFIALKNFPGKVLAKGFFNTFIGVPTVGLGLILFIIFSRAGPLGFFGLLYTPTAIILGEAILIIPIVVSLTTTAIEAVDPDIMNQAKTLGASESQASITVLQEALSGIFLAGIASFNRAIAELGVAQMVGGNIEHWTDVLTTTIALETQKGNFALSIALAIILITIVFAITITVNIFQRRRK
ncbi:MAG: ABC transporter permease [Candidatus Bathyarchaeota archaeon]|nr:ABC transporter permease [Candidatus Bathyarchaeota archaeon]MDH5787170.1 ABC transporter permease [Candidatus Bathyarchaeota archaeon]